MNLSEDLTKQYKKFEIKLDNKVENIESKVDDNRTNNNIEQNANKT